MAASTHQSWKGAAALIPSQTRQNSCADFSISRVLLFFLFCIVVFPTGVKDPQLLYEMKTPLAEGARKWLPYSINDHRFLFCQLGLQGSSK